MSVLNVVLVEDDILACNRFIEYADTRDDFILLSTTNSSKQAISDIFYYLPDAIILDLELHKGSGNGLEVLSGIRELKKHPYVVVTTNNSSQITYESARGLGADFIFYKHQQDYSEKAVVDFLCSLKDVIKGHNIQKNLSDVGSPQCVHKRKINFINEELNIIGINPKATGYVYLSEAISILVDENPINLCSIVAKKYKKSESSVRMAMQRAIEKAWNTNDIEELLSNYTARITSENGCPTTTEFVHYYASKVKNRM